MELKVIDAKGQVSGSLSVSDALFAREYNEALVHQLVNAYLANARSGNRAQKTRAEVKHSTKKPWRQKGTGRARSGMTSSPLWRKGGRAFPNKPDENFTQKVNRKMYRAGMATILSQLTRDERLFAIEALTAETPKTKVFAEQVKNLGLEQVLFVTKQLDENVYLASRNLPNVLVLEAQQVDPYSLLRYKKVIITKDAVAQLEEQWV
ncbi:TPA: 50S ribosomal protein L4 [Neisseria meningitidis]|jgi:LSU ribosomal protein L4P|uniref:Large ribosomal subunit protein uL4 n=13 Tax=Neisseria meningitidis TaxID=487 RepID=RL4_NEIMB|nr:MULTISPECIES: 50S ribosomal protein L4 [Neisseria]A1KRH4.1 RecName: Full=Large ribosomal subunit protein uL4; AltName: Full=50S ribosomal protein L4 [Neisseria meningitidis FAM18]A9M3W5.1 RecName: Full=Large ribosomal subunit protein uL4; AltName: Full=50S ribosomal protein L4 [Neisseria meningitidis 053442]P61056.1 RecName: Full=Large ribosomal subunit protein uL4; AltName: Full=50S ribosomal protein L4 [Neisseria meningitidis Z2491]P61057.1 RecName: Full=Large ribosomal subunit protein uL4